MKIIGVIPARYNSTRFPGKPLADVLGKPMIWWAYHQALKVQQIDEVYVATDDKRIEDVCKGLGINVIMTSEDNATPNDRIYEVSQKIEADYYVTIMGDEPLIEPKTIAAIIPEKQNGNEMYVANLMTEIKDPTEVVDFTNQKVVTNKDGKGLFISRSPIPYPKGTLDYKYKKYVGVCLFTKNALDFYHNSSPSTLERAEENDCLRFMENGIDVWFKEVDTQSLSVDTKKDLERVREKLSALN